MKLVCSASGWLANDPNQALFRQPIVRIYSKDGGWTAFFAVEQCKRRICTLPPWQRNPVRSGPRAVLGSLRVRLHRGRAEDLIALVQSRSGGGVQQRPSASSGGKIGRAIA